MKEYMMKLMGTDDIAKVDPEAFKKAIEED